MASHRRIFVILAFCICFRSLASPIDTSFHSPVFTGRTPLVQFISDTKGGAFLTAGVNRPINAIDGAVSGIVRLDRIGNQMAFATEGLLFNRVTGAVCLTNGTLYIAAERPRDFDANRMPYVRIYRILPTGVLDAAYQSPAFDNAGRYMSVQPDGKLLVTSGFNAVTGNGGLRGLQRLNTDGSLDTGFHPVFSQAISGFEASYSIYAPPAVDSQGRILIAGIFKSVNSVPRMGLARLLSNGDLDPSFAATNQFNAAPGFAPWVGGVLIQAGDKVVVAGRRLRVAGSAADYTVVRLLPDGSMDPTFSAIFKNTISYHAVYALLPHTQGKMLLGAEGFFVVEQDGGFQWAFNPPAYTGGGHIDNIVPGGNGFIAGTAVQASSPLQVNAERAHFLSNGEFAVGGYTMHDAQHLAVPEGISFQGTNLLAHGFFDRVDQATNPAIVRLHRDGTLEGTFSLRDTNDVAIPNVVGSQAVVVNSDGSFFAIVATGDSPATPVSSELLRFDPDGRRDANFGSLASSLNNSESGMMKVSGGLIYWRNTWTEVANASFFCRKILANGEADSSWNAPTNRVGNVTVPPTGITTVETGHFRVLAQNSADELICAYSPGLAPSGDFQYTLIRLKTDGHIDGAFAAPTTFRSRLRVDKGPTTVIVPRSPPFRAAVNLKNGDILVGGSFELIGGKLIRGLALLHADGSLEPTFDLKLGLTGDHGPVAPEVHSLALAPDGKVWMTGSFDKVSGVGRNGVAVLKPTGELDAEFDAGVVQTDYGNYPTDVLIDGNSALITGAFQVPAAVWPTSILSLTGPLPRPVIGPISLSNGMLTVRWDIGVLESAPTATGVWTTVTAATPPTHIVPAQDSATFFRAAH